MATWGDTEPSREAALIVNLRSRSGPKATERVLRELERQGVRIRERHLVADGPALVAAAGQAIAAGARTIVVGGGDGTISSVADLLAGRPDLALGLLPVGTGNEMARSLGIPLDLESACRVIAKGRVEAVDLGEANGDYFLHTALIGQVVEMERDVPPLLKVMFGRAAYVVPTLRALLRARPFRATVAVGEEKWEGDTVLIVVGNGRFHGPARVLAPSTDNSASGLAVYTPRSSGWPARLRLAVGLWVTRRRQPSLLLAKTADWARVETDPPQPVGLDGEFGCMTPVTFRLARRALRVLVP